MLLSLDKLFSFIFMFYLVALEDTLAATVFPSCEEGLFPETCLCSFTWLLLKAIKGCAKSMEPLFDGPDDPFFF